MMMMMIKIIIIIIIIIIKARVIILITIHFVLISKDKKKKKVNKVDESSVCRILSPARYLDEIWRVVLSVPLRRFQTQLRVAG